MKLTSHYGDVILSAMASPITSLTIVYSTVCSGADQIKRQSSASLAFVRGIHRWPVNSPHKWPVSRKIFPFNDVIMYPLWIVKAAVKWTIGNTPFNILLTPLLTYIKWVDFGNKVLFKTYYQKTFIENIFRMLSICKWRKRFPWWRHMLWKRFPIYWPFYRVYGESEPEDCPRKEG